MDETKKKAGLGFWADRVLQELQNVEAGFEADPVHDLRVALRRCRSMADGFLTVDPDPAWKELKRLAKGLFSRLGELRDIQVMRHWVTELGSPDDPIAQTLQNSFEQLEKGLKEQARGALPGFDVKRWQVVTQHLAGRARKVPIEGLVFQEVAAERWEQARQLHRQALRNRSQVAFHRLRIGLKKFRYTVENFLPERHEKWGADLRGLQDALGEIHDLDVLSAMLNKHAELDPNLRQKWQKTIQEARQLRVERYREKMVGPHSLWGAWRADLPSGPRLEQAALAHLQTWASFLDPDFSHSKLVTALSLQLHDGLVHEKVLRSKASHRRILEAACLLHDVGRSKSKAGHHKYSYRLIRKLSPPLSWTSQELQAVAAVARYHRGRLPDLRHKCLTKLPYSVRPSIIRLAGILRLAHTLDFSHDKQVRRVVVARNDGTVVVNGDGYTECPKTAERVAAARYLLETTCGIAVLVRPAATNTQSPASTQISSPSAPSIPTAAAGQ